MPRLIFLLFSAALAGVLVSCSPDPDSADRTGAEESGREYSVTAWDGDREVHLRYYGEREGGHGTLFISQSNRPETVDRLRITIGEAPRESVEPVELEEGVYTFRVHSPAAERFFLEFESGGESYSLNIELQDVSQEAQPQSRDEGVVYLDKRMQWQLGIRTGTASKRTVPDLLTAYGRLFPDPGHVTSVVSPVNGQIEALSESASLSPGSEIRRGTGLLTLSPSLDPEGTWVERRIAWRQAGEAYRNARELFEQNAISNQELRLREREYEARRAGIEELTGRGAIVADLTDEDRLTLVSNRDGRIWEQHLAPGRSVTGGDLLLSIYDPARLWLQSEIYNDHLETLGDITTLQVERSPDRFLTVPEGSFELIGRDRRSDRTGLRSLLTWRLQDEEGLYRIGEPVRMRIGDGSGDDVLALPDEAVFDAHSHRILYVQESGETFRRRLVRTGRSSSGWTEIRSGLEEGERVVTEGVYPLRLLSGNIRIDEDHDHQ